MSDLTDRFDHIFERIGQAARESGRDPSEVRLAAISKTHAAGAIAELFRHWRGKGRPVFGESYAQEALPKMAEVKGMLGNELPAEGLEWHFVGHVQSRKAKEITGKFRLIHSLDSIKLAEAMQKAWRSVLCLEPVGLDDMPRQAQRVLVQVNTGREAQKSGLYPEDLEKTLAAIAAMPELRAEGLMCIPPVVESAEQSRPFFVLLRELRDKMRSRTGLELPHLSMGMSSDFEAAIKEGATIVRVGTDIFGPRGT